jgi:hypothetical protein
VAAGGLIFADAIARGRRMDIDRSQFDSARGERQLMEAMAISALAAAEKAGMVDQLNRRLFDLDPDELLELHNLDNGRSEYRYRPMVELLLHEIIAAGADSTLNAVEQQRRICWALDIAGF